MIRSFEFFAGKGIKGIEFGSKPQQMADWLGSPDDTRRYYPGTKFESTMQIWRKSPVLSANFDFESRLYEIEFDPKMVESFNFRGIDFAVIEPLEIVNLLFEAEENLFQAQGGSLYFPKLGFGYLQFETDTSAWKVFQPDSLNESLRKITLQEAKDYYSVQRQL